MKCHGLDATSGELIELSFDGLISGADSFLSRSEEQTWLAPGWIDLQVNGFAGVDYCSPRSSHQEIGRSIRAMFATGVTRFFPTVITGSEENMTAALANLAAAKQTLPEGAAMEAFHVEGPFISPEDGPRGAHPQRWVRPPDLEEFRRMQDAAQGHIRLITISPEWPESVHFIEAAVSDGIVVSIGHTRATPEQIQQAVRAGASMSTHLGNGAHAVLPRHPNYIWEQLAADKLTASFIVDTIHLGRSFLKCALRAKGIERSVLITDAVMPAGCQPGRYWLGEVAVELHADGSVRLVNGSRLAGSALRMDHGVSNLMRFAGLSLRDAVTMATRNPARAGRIPSRQRGLTPGERADLVRFRLNEESKELEVLETYLDGQRVFHAGQLRQSETV